MGDAQIHRGHRQRLKKMYQDQGIEALSDVQMLELLLFYSIPRKDTNPLAHDLLDRYGSLAAVLQASEAELRKAGLSKNTALFLKLVPDIMRQSEISETRDIVYINSTEDAGMFFIPRFLYKQNEEIHLLCLSSAHRVKGCFCIGKGIVNGAETSIRKIMEASVEGKASCIIIAHNHPGGSVEPSKADILMTEQLITTMSAVKIPLVDHLIISERKYTSMADRGIIAELSSSKGGV